MLLTQWDKSFRVKTYLYHFYVHLTLQAVVIRGDKRREPLLADVHLIS